MVERLLLFLSCCAALGSTAQDISFGKPRKLPPHISSHCEEILPLLFDDGKGLFFVRSSCPENTGGKFSGSDVWVSDFRPDSGWSRPGNTNHLFNDKMHNAIVGIGDGETIYQLNTSSAKKTKGIHFSRRVGNSWMEPQLIPLPFLDTDGFLGLYVSDYFNVILISMDNKMGSGQEDLYLSRKDASGKWSEPRTLGPIINTNGFEISPFLSTDGKRLYFTSSGHLGLGDGDIYYSDRLDETWEAWSSPVNLGNQVNSKKFDAYFSIYDSVAYFSSNREGEFSDLYVVSVKNADDSIQQQIERIVTEAKNILVDLGDDTTDSLTTNTRSTLIEFENNSDQLNYIALAQLNSVQAQIKELKLKKVTLIAHTNGVESQIGKLYYRRMEVIENYLKGTSLSSLVVELEMTTQDVTDSVDKDGIVEIRY